MFPAAFFDKGGVSLKLSAGAGLSGSSTEAGALIAGLNGEPYLNGLALGSCRVMRANKNLGCAGFQKTL